MTRRRVVDRRHHGLGGGVTVIRPWTIAVDLGKRVSGYAVFDEVGVLVEAGEVRARGGQPRVMARQIFVKGVEFAPARGIWVGEKMLDYTARGARKKALEGLRQVSFLLQENLPEDAHWVEYTANRWKGNVPKQICHRRARAALSVWERSRVLLDTKESMDALGIGMFHNNRLNRGMVS